ncbi:cob(I)yrinic acid a,c-diamide adenosyltransferase [Clostridium hydrogeniformans]|uniref:cob(I)yrinic acid a,c-diamide adenosyltransferase n=1 Tax=Clostridium hydrogeniformans TaxID=349933 RepID=UPI0006897EFE|nr:cob(I)yrinic acid a,c-diamide adenosyltransferase [Clostridium hydrogeniformans]
MKVYTKTGDKGTTGNLLGERIAKDSTFLELQGDIDEVNAQLGYLNALLQNNTNLNYTEKKNVMDFIVHIENALYNMGVEISYNFSQYKIKESHVKELENEIDLMLEKTPPQRHFILYSGSLEGTYAQVCRSTTRRAERVFVKYLKEGNFDSYPQSYLYINRLSDYLFVLSRFINFKLNKEETIMKQWV